MRFISMLSVVWRGRICMICTVWRQMRPSASWHLCKKAIDCLYDVYFRCSEWKEWTHRTWVVRSRFNETFWTSLKHLLVFFLISSLKKAKECKEEKILYRYDKIKFKLDIEIWNNILLKPVCHQRLKSQVHFQIKCWNISIYNFI
jgi:hypothetical protein